MSKPPAITLRQSIAIYADPWDRVWRYTVAALLLGIQADAATLNHGADAHALYTAMSILCYVAAGVLALYHLTREPKDTHGQEDTYSTPCAYRRAEAAAGPLGADHPLPEQGAGAAPDSAAGRPAHQAGEEPHAPQGPA